MNLPFKSYADVVEHMSKARDKSKGRPICSGHWRMFQDGDKVVIKSTSSYFKDTYAQFNPDDTVEFHDENPRSAYEVPQSYHYMVLLTTGFWTDRVAKGRYHIHPPTVGIQYRQVSTYWRRILTGLPEDAVPVTLFSGVKMNLLTYECLNPQEYVAPVAIPEVRIQWLRDSKWLKEQFKVLAKLGALTDEKILRPSPYFHGQPQQYSNLLRMMKDRVIDVTDLSMLANSFFWGSVPSSNILCQRFDTFMRTNSLRLRNEYGVFGGNDNDKS